MEDAFHALAEHAAGARFKKPVDRLQGTDGWQASLRA
jgi:hypothetical protein